MITDSAGVVRHAMTKEDLRRLYRLIDEFESDCTIGEHAFNANYIAGMKTAVHQRIRTATNGKNKKV